MRAGKVTIPRPRTWITFVSTGTKVQVWEVAGSRAQATASCALAVVAPAVSR